MTTADSSRHGHHNGYYVDGCRCELCRAASAAYTREIRARRKAAIPPHAEGSRHLYTNFGCRCDLCKAVERQYQLKYRNRPGGREQTMRNTRSWAQRNPERYAERRRRQAYIDTQRKRQRIVAGDLRDITERDWRRLCARYSNCCAYCGEAKPLTMDHIVPVIRGGRHSIGNLLPACRNCNSAKRTRLIVEWRAGRKAAA